MAQVCSSPFGGLGLYATKEYKEGDVILQEDPLATLAPANDEDVKKASESIEPPSSVAKELHGKFKGMVSLTWANVSNPLGKVSRLMTCRPDRQNPQALAWWAIGLYYCTMFVE